MAKRRHVRPWPIGAFLISALALTTAIAPGAWALEVMGTVASAEPVTLDGSVRTTFSEGAVVLLSDRADLRATIEAESLRLIHFWETGTAFDARPNPSAPGMSGGMRSETGEFNRTLRGVTGTIAFDQAPTRIVAIGRGDEAHAEVEGTGRLVAEASGNRTLAHAGQTPANSPLPRSGYRGFWYEVPADWTRTDGFDRTVVTGSFTIFVDNVMVSLQTQNMGEWSNWTGTKYGAGVDAVRRYESRMTWMHVQNGTLVLEEPSGIAAFSPVARLHLDGTARVEGAVGTLATPTEVLNFDRDGITLRGVGEVGLRATAPLDRRLRSADEVPWIRLDPGDSLDLEVGPDVERQLVPAWATGSGPSDRSAWAVSAFAVLLVLGAGLLLARLVPEGSRAHALTAHLSRSADACLDVGRRISADGSFKKALPWFRRARDLEPSNPAAWLELAYAIERTHGAERALGAIAAARDTLDHVPLDLVELEGLCALETGRTDQAAEAFEELFERSPSMGQGVLATGTIPPELVQRVLGAHGPTRRDDGGLIGYV